MIILPLKGALCLCPSARKGKHRHSLPRQIRMGKKIEGGSREVLRAILNVGIDKKKCRDAQRSFQIVSVWINILNDIDLSKSMVVLK